MHGEGSRDPDHCKVIAAAKAEADKKKAQHGNKGKGKQQGRGTAEDPIDVMTTTPSPGADMRQIGAKPNLKYARQENPASGSAEGKPNADSNPRQLGKFDRCSRIAGEEILHNTRI